MVKQLTYNILQYKHSQLPGEALNVGILFFFGPEETPHFVTGNFHRVKAAYADFDPRYSRRL